LGCEGRGVVLPLLESRECRNGMLNSANIVYVSVRVQKPHTQNLWKYFLLSRHQIKREREIHRGSETERDREKESGGDRNKERERKRERERERKRERERERERERDRDTHPHSWDGLHSLSAAVGTAHSHHSTMEIGPADVARGRDQDYVDVAGLSVIALTQVIALLTSTARHHLSPSVVSTNCLPFQPRRMG